MTVCLQMALEHKADPNEASLLLYVSDLILHHVKSMFRLHELHMDMTHLVRREAQVRIPMIVV